MTTKEIYLKTKEKHLKINYLTSKFTLKTIGFAMLTPLLFSCSNDDNETVNEATPIALDCNIELQEALGFNAFVLNDVSLTSGDSKGPIAMGGDLSLNGLFTTAAHTSGTFYYDNENQASSLIVNGKINYSDAINEGVHLNNGYVKVGDLTGSVLHDIDNNNAINNTRITQGGYNDQPRIHVQRNQVASTINAIDIIDFEGAFEALNTSSFNYSQLPNNVTIKEGNKITLLEDSFNVLHVTGDELNNLTNFTFNNQPTTTSPLIININQEEDFIWNVQNQAGIGDQHGAHIIFNFYNNDGTITLEENGATIIGTVLAPNSHVIKRTSGNINGQLIAESYSHINGALNHHVFDVCEENSCDLVVSLGEDISLGLNETFILSAIANYEDVVFEWSTEDVTDFIEVSPIETTVYTVTATLENGCTATDSITISVGENTEQCTGEEFSVNVNTVVENFVNFLNIDIAVNTDQVINYTTYLNDVALDLSANVNVTKGCNTITINLDEEFAFSTNTEYTLIVTGEGWSESLNFTIQ